MANKKANNKFIWISIRSVFLLILLLAAAPGWADISAASVVLSSDTNGDGVAGIGDTVTISCRSTTTSTTGEFPYVTAPSLGIANLTLGQLAGNLYSAILTISPGGFDGTVVFTFGDDSPSSPQRSIVVDNRRPSSQYGPSANSGTGLGGTFKLNDPLELNLVLNSAADEDSVTGNLTAIGLGSNHVFGPNGVNAFKLALTFPSNKEGVAKLLAVTAVDNAGNATTWNTVSVNYDTIVPVIKSVTAVNMTAGKAYITAGDSIKIQAVISNYDNDTVVASNSALFAGGAVTMTKEAGGALGSEAVFEYIHYVTEDPAIQSIATYFKVTATDDAGNAVDRVSNYLRVDSLPPELANLSIEVLRNGIKVGNNTAIINDSLRIFGEPGRQEGLRSTAGA